MITTGEGVFNEVDSRATQGLHGLRPRLTNPENIRSETLSLFAWQRFKNAGELGRYQRTLFIVIPENPRNSHICMVNETPNSLLDSWILLAAFNTIGPISRPTVFKCRSGKA